jgi:hypothetical protein
MFRNIIILHFVYIWYIENCILLLILGIRNFFNHPMYCIDFLIVSISMLFDITSIFILNDNDNSSDDDLLYDDIIQFIIIGRLWRFVGLSYDLMMIEKETETETSEHEHDNNDINNDTRSIVESLQGKIIELEQQILLLHTGSGKNKNEINKNNDVVVSQQENISSSTCCSGRNGTNTTDDYHQLT